MMICWICYVKIIINILQEEQAIMSHNNKIHIRAEVTIVEGKKEEYKKLIQDIIPLSQL
jgi:metal-responsive CopG/Arc/MetJ family transcriptional regulator